MDDNIKKALIEIVGEDNVTDRLIDMVSYSYDSSEHNHRPDCAVWATTTEQVSKIMKLANEKKIPIIARGAGTGLSGMAVPLKGGIVLDLNRMDKIISISIEDRCAVVEPGVVYADLDKALAPYGFCFPPDPGSGTVCTLGGNVSTNAGGVKGAKYGTTRDYILGLEVVLADGRVMNTGSSTIKCVSGYDLTRLIVGSEGTLGIVTQITMKINPRPLATATAVATFDQLEDAGKAVTQIMSSGIIPAVMEIMDRPTIQCINQNTELGLPEVEVMLLVETDGYTQAEADFQLEKVISVFKVNNPLEITQAKNKEEATKLWLARKSAYAVLARIQTHFVLEDVTVPMGRIADLLRGISGIAKKYNVQVATFGHAGDGNLHPQFLYDGYNLDEVERVEKAIAELFQLSIDLNGTLTGEHGIGIAKAKFMTLEHDEVEMDMMRTVKKAFDPNNILNPGKMALEVN
ncbi:MAG: FAD-linked oxidase C-terminal domain-containing protein [Pseudomonadota bacterium]